MSDPNQTILVALAVSTISPSILFFFTNRARRKEKILDWQREDQKELEKTRKADQVADRLLASNKTTNSKLDIIHTLVNSNMTAAMKAELEATIREVAMMREVISLNSAAGRDPSAEALRAIESTDDKIEELKSALSDRLKQTEIADRQAAQGA